MDVLVCGGPDDRDGMHLFPVDRERTAVAQQDRASFLGAIRDSGVRRAVVLGDVVRPRRVVEESEREQLAQDLVDACFERRLGDRTVGERSFDLGRVVAAGTDVEVQAGIEICFGLVAGEEVRDHEAVRPEQAAEGVLQEEGIGAGVLTFEQVVGAHHGRAVSLHDRRFERGELDLVQRARVDVDVYERTAAVDAE